VDPGPFTYILPSTASTFYFPQALFIYLLQTNIIFHTIRLILCFQQTSEIDNLCKLGQSILVVLCAGSTLLLALKLRPRHFLGADNKFLVPLPKSASNNLRKWFLSPTGRLNFGFMTEGKLTVVLITPYSWGSQLVYAPVARIEKGISLCQ
jgi:hypothetical protein